MANVSSSISLPKSPDAGGGGTETLCQRRILSSKLYLVVPLSKKKVLYPYRKQVGGSILAAKLAKERGRAINVGGVSTTVQQRKEDYEAKRSVDQMVELMSGTKTKEYLEQLDKALEVAKNKFDPELVVYNAGTDILDGDPLGRLKVSPDGVAIRDEKVFRFAREKDIPLLMLASGGY